MGVAPLSCGTAAPLVSVIVATYNRSQPLRHAIQSVLESTFTDWELLVVGDACTDDTAQCMAAYTDARIRFVNLPDRCGDQSGPNNHGVAISRGRYLAFLNHDDYYLPDHLATCISELESTGADLVWTPVIALIPRSDLTPADRPYGFKLIGVPVTAEYSPTSFYIASSWVFRRALADLAGPWRAPKKIHFLPSQDWLFRAFRCGAALRFIPRATVVAIIAGDRQNCYAHSESAEHVWLARWVREYPRYRESMLEEAALQADRQRRHNEIYPPMRTIGRMLFSRPVLALCRFLKIHPRAFYYALLRRRGDVQLRNERRKTGSV